MSDCTHSRSDLVELLRYDVEGERRRRLADRVDACDACAGELRTLRRTWGELPAASAAPAPAEGRKEVLAYARGAAARPAGVPAGFWRAAFLGGLGSLGGYLVLSLLHPIPSAVEFCRVRVFGDPAMTLGQVCLVYAGVSALYAGLPVAVAAFLSSATGERWRLGLAEAGVFTLLALPVLALQFGLENAIITVTVLTGLTLGAAAGGIAGAVAGDARRRAGARV